jgi:predicted transcriptional regulator
MAKPEPAIFEDHDETLESAVDAEGLADLQAGRVVSDDAMRAWLRSWGTPDELPPPNCDD